MLLVNLSYFVVGVNVFVNVYVPGRRSPNAKPLFRISYFITRNLRSGQLDTPHRHSSKYTSLGWTNPPRKSCRCSLRFPLCRHRPTVFRYEETIWSNWNAIHQITNICSIYWLQTTAPHQLGERGCSIDQTHSSTFDVDCSIVFCEGPRDHRALWLPHFWNR